MDDPVLNGFFNFLNGKTGLKWMLKWVLGGTDEWYMSTQRRGAAVDSFTHPDNIDGGLATPRRAGHLVAYDPPCVRLSSCMFMCTSLQSTGWFRILRSRDPS